MEEKDGLNRVQSGTTSGSLLRTLTRKQFAEALQVSENLVRKWQRLGKVRVVKLGRCVRVPIEELLRAVAGAIR